MADVEHGGRREGAGRPPLEGRVTRCYALTEHHVKLLEQYRQRIGLPSASEALRHLLESDTRHLVALRAEIKLLRAALEQIVRGWQVGLSAGELQDIAEAALANTKRA